jgi:prepilin-type N-terminal cleavage/methylation domain-containing protein
VHSMNRRGFTLAEIIVAIVLAAVVGLAIVRMMNSTQRLTRVQYARIDAQQSAMSSAYYLNSVIRELDASEGDVQVASATTMQVRAMRWTALSCSAVTTSGSDRQITVRNTHTFGARAPDITLDSLLVFSENAPGTRSDDTWLVGWMIATAASTCPDGTAATTYTLGITAGSGGNAALDAGFTLGSPIRGFQIEELSLYDAGGGAYWFARRTKDVAGTWSAREHLAGPLASDGLAFTYRDTLNVVTATLASVASVGVTIRTRSTDITGAAAGNVRDSLITRIALRNNKRF